MSDLPEPICIVDDDISVRRSLLRLLASENRPAIAFEGGAEFLGYAKENKVRLALVDFCMPGIDGLEVLSHLRKCSPETRVIVMTAQTGKATEDAIRAGGSFDFMLKPFKSSALLDSIQRALSPKM